MITLADCQAFCDVDAKSVAELASRESLTMIAAYAQAQTMHEVISHVSAELYVLPDTHESSACVVVYHRRLAA